MPSNHLYCGILFVAYCYLTGAQITLQPVIIEPDNSDGEVCANPSQRLQIQNQVRQSLNSSNIEQFIGVYRHFPANSCADIYQGHPSDYYWLNVANEPQLVYCSLNENRCCGECDGKWMRIAYLNMSDPSEQCPDGWREAQSPIRTCRRQMDISINSVNYTSYEIPYSRVCGRIVAYQFGTPNGFVRQTPESIDGAYVDGISVTYGYPRNHIWTFAAARETERRCPCISDGTAAPSLVENDYFCEIGRQNNNINFIANNPLWDGQGCAAFQACCRLNSPPTFCKQLAQPTTEDIEIRIMSNATDSNYLEDEDTPVELIEIFVQ